MTKTRRLTESELDRLRPMEQKLRAAARRGDLAAAKALASDIQRILRKAGNETRLQKAKAWLYESALEAGDLDFATAGVSGIRSKMRPTTRIYLEATALLAVCYLRRRDLEAAKPLMEEAIGRVGNITSHRRRRQFYRRLMDRFEEEWAVGILSEPRDEELDPSKVQDEAGTLVVSSSDDELFERLGDALPKHSVEQLLEVYRFSHDLLPSGEKLLLPSPEDKKRRKEVGGTIYRAARRAVWKALCDPTSDTYQMWCHKGLMVALDKKVIGAAVASALTGIGLGVYAFAIPITAILIKLGVDIFCESTTAEGLMIGLDE